jgi:hypothetical protein
VASHGSFYSGDLQKYPKTGEVWELPVFLPLGKNKSNREKYLLLVNPWFGEARPYYCHSMVEVYANKLKSLTTRVYPVRADALGLRLWADGPLNLTTLQVWRLKSAYRQ